jgi:hypothetical protein
VVGTISCPIGVSHSMDIHSDPLERLAAWPMSERLTSVVVAVGLGIFGEICYSCTTAPSSVTPASPTVAFVMVNDRGNSRLDSSI